MGNPEGQVSSILTSRVANHGAGFALSCHAWCALPAKNPKRACCAGFYPVNPVGSVIHSSSATIVTGFTLQGMVIKGWFPFANYMDFLQNKPFLSCTFLSGRMMFISSRFAWPASFPARIPPRGSKQGGPITAFTSCQRLPTGSSHRKLSFCEPAIQTSAENGDRHSPSLLSGKRQKKISLDVWN